jgi:hypothetical protein
MLNGDLRTDSHTLYQKQDATFIQKINTHINSIY